MVFSHPGAAIWTEGAAGAGAAAAEGGKSGSNHPFRWSALRISISPWPTLIQKNMVVSVNEGTPLKKNHFRLGFSMKRPFSYWCYLYWGSSIYGNPKGWLPPWLWKISPFYIRSIGAKKPNDDYTHTHTKKKKWGACVSKRKMIPPKQQFDRFWYCKYWNQIGIDGLSSYWLADIADPEYFSRRPLFHFGI